ncbi:hypothetical protein, partial [Xanthomonas fragariae]|uniref:hypothetical protein n=1 Tax=Xanthomonas fragariae TaxID=48664 RepID=UPI001F3C15EA
MPIPSTGRARLAVSAVVLLAALIGDWHASCSIAVTPPSQPAMMRDTSAQDQVLRSIFGVYWRGRC